MILFQDTHRHFFYAIWCLQDLGGNIISSLQYEFIDSGNNLWPLSCPHEYIKRERFFGHNEFSRWLDNCVSALENEAHRIAHIAIGQVKNLKDEFKNDARYASVEEIFESLIESTIEALHNFMKIKIDNRYIDDIHKCRKHYSNDSQWVIEVW